MATGNLPGQALSADNERKRLEINGMKTAYHSQAANTSYTATFTKQIKDGVLLTGYASVHKGIYIYGSTSTGNISITPVYAASGLTITASGNNLTIANTSTTSTAVHLFIQYQGDLPSWTATT